MPIVWTTVGCCVQSSFKFHSQSFPLPSKGRSIQTSRNVKRQMQTWSHVFNRTKINIELTKRNSTQSPANALSWGLSRNSYERCRIHRARPFVSFHLLQNVNTWARDFIYCKTRQWKILLTSKRDTSRDFYTDSWFMLSIVYYWLQKAILLLTANTNV